MCSYIQIFLSHLYLSTTSCSATTPPPLLNISGGIAAQEKRGVAEQLVVSGRVLSQSCHQRWGAGVSVPHILQQPPSQTHGEWDSLESIVATRHAILTCQCPSDVSTTILFTNTQHTSTKSSDKASKHQLSSSGQWQKLWEQLRLQLRRASTRWERWWRKNI